MILFLDDNIEEVGDDDANDNDGDDGECYCNDDRDGGICPDMLVVVVMIVAMMVIMAMYFGLKWSI